MPSKDVVDATRAVLVAASIGAAVATDDAAPSCCDCVNR